MSLEHPFLFFFFFFFFFFVNKIVSMQFYLARKSHFISNFSFRVPQANHVGCLIEFASCPSFESLILSCFYLDLDFLEYFTNKFP